MILYHGTSDPNLVPDFNFPNHNNDYGKGLYTTPSFEMAAEWSKAPYSKLEDGYVYEYNIDMSGFHILDMLDMNSMYWLTMLLTHRKVGNLSEVARSNLERLKKKYYLEPCDYDIVLGYRADDSYFTYAREFITGQIFRDTFDKALELGELGIQYCVKSEEAFSRLVEVSKTAVPDIYKEKFITRDESARKEYKRLRSAQVTGITIYDVLREEGL